MQPFAHKVEHQLEKKEILDSGRKRRINAQKPSLKQQRKKKNSSIDYAHYLKKAGF